jgi:hypothetical protein
MNELRERLTALGLTESQVEGAIEAVADVVKAKLPTDYRGAVDALLAGDSPDLAALTGGLLAQVKGLFR